MKTTNRIVRFPKAFLVSLVFVVSVALSDLPIGAETPQYVSADRLTAIFAGEVPKNLAELRAMEQRQTELAIEALRSTVAVQLGPAHGSGVIIDAEGYVLTASHVAGKPDRTATVTLHDGTRVRAKSLGMNRSIDAGMLKILDDPPGDSGQWPYATMGSSASIQPGSWCLATGHPGGYQPQRGPVVRIGRVLSNEQDVLVTDCTLLSGDSGGPLFDLNGHVIGIHSRITNELTDNMHVPVDGYRESWTRMVSGESWGHLPGFAPFLGVQGSHESEDATIVEVLANSPAQRAGIRAGDVIVKLDDETIRNFGSLQQAISNTEPGDRVSVQVRRNGEIHDFRVTIGRQGG